MASKGDFNSGNDQPANSKHSANEETKAKLVYDRMPKGNIEFMSDRTLSTNN